MKGKIGQMIKTDIFSSFIFFEESICARLKIENILVFSFLLRFDALTHDVTMLSQSYFERVKSTLKHHTHESLTCYIL